jgi:hypothetical protein
MTAAALGVAHHSDVRDTRLAQRRGTMAPVQPAESPAAEVISMASVQTLVINPKTLSWAWPTTAKDQSGASVALALSDIVAVEVQFDGGAVIDVTSVTGQSGPQASLVLASVPAYLALAPGQHTVDVAAKTAEGSIGAFSAPVSFLIAVVPDSPTALALA